MVEVKKQSIPQGKVLDEYDGVTISHEFPYNMYSFKEPFSKDDLALASLFVEIIERKRSLTELAKKLKLSKKFVDSFQMEIIQFVESEDLLMSFPSEDKFNELHKILSKLFKDFFPKMKQSSELAKYILDNSIGFKQIAPFLKDESLEEIMVNGFSKPVFVFHKKFGMCKTNIILDHALVNQLLSKIALFAGRDFNEANPLLDAALPDGSRVNATFSLVTPKGHSLTIRKFTKIPLSIVDLIANNTLNSNVASFLWLMVEGMRLEPKNIIITGGTGSGKTTLLNVLSTFIPYSNRVVSIEDTLELDLGSRENWIQMEAARKKTKLIVSMNDLLINCLRMRPDRIVVGEVRGEEAQTLFTAMDTGHGGILGTLHSNSAKEMLIRLKTAPMLVPESMLPLLNLTVVMFKKYNPNQGGIRRIKEIAEIERMEEKVLLSNLFEYSHKDDEISRTEVPSRVIDELAEKTFTNKNQLKEELLIRKKILEWMIEKGIKDNREVEKVIQMYYLDPTALLKKISKDL